MAEVSLIYGSFCPSPFKITQYLRAAFLCLARDILCSPHVYESLSRFKSLLFFLGEDFLPALDALKAEGDVQTGIDIVKRAIEEPVRQIAANAGLEGSVIIENIRRSGKKGYGFNAYSEEYVDMISAGIVDPTKVTRSALENAASVAGMVLTTESLVTDIKEPAPPAPAMPGGGMDY